MKPENIRHIASCFGLFLLWSFAAALAIALLETYDHSRILATIALVILVPSLLVTSGYLFIELVEKMGRK